MPLKLDTPHTYSPGHGEELQTFEYVIIHTQTVKVPNKALILQMQYGNIVEGEWEESPEPVHNIRIQNIPAQMQGGEVDNPAYDPEDPDSNPKTWGEIEVEPANPVFDNLREAFEVSPEDAGKKGYDLVGEFLYGYLIDEGYYQGEIV